MADISCGAEIKEAEIRKSEAKQYLVLCLLP